MRIDLLKFPGTPVWKPDFEIRDERIKGRRNRLYWLIFGRWELIVTRRLTA